MRHFFVLLVFFALCSTRSYSQFVVTRVQDLNVNTTQDGFYYSLPRTVLKIDLVIEKIQQRKGPLAEFTAKYLGATEYIDNNTVTFRLVDVLIDQLSEPDPQQIYYIQFPAERPKDAKPTGFSLTPTGTLAAFGLENTPQVIRAGSDIHQTFLISDGGEDFNYFADYNRKKVVDTVIRKITIDTVTIDRFLFKTSWVDKSPEEKANEAAMQIARIRESRFNLLTGYQEVNYGESMRYMDEQLMRMEQKYLELFLGKELRTLETQTIYFTPTKENQTQLLYHGTDGTTLEAKLTPGGTADKLPENPLMKQDNIFYRIPEAALLEVTQNGKVFYSEKMRINQYGIVAAVPLKRTSLQFDPQTGTLIKIIRE
ncbi:MAG: DUF4831 family protein [Bacteroidales bacterium]|nr:DUF4831 family protein [Bacteroidales bacterium]